MVELFKVSVMSFDQWDIYVFQNMKCVIFYGWVMRWQCILIYIHICIMIMIMIRTFTWWWCYVVLRTPMDGHVIVVAYGEIILSLYRGCMGDDSSGRVIGVLAWCIAHVWHTQVNTSMGSMYYFLVFNI